MDFDDRTLVHLQVVLGSKLRRGESFFLSWTEPPAVGGGGASLWIHPSIPLYFKYYGRKIPTINRAWIDAFVASANSGQGLLLSLEPPTPPDAERRAVT